ncbi:hypothetical protein BpHYR1_034247 [Brachionus plicatilis]|uniref:Uncharacterized protein n=1 Tax=Brachionus plicatilis TaxID=10195 RepID=A0A3M7Q513_BRAPC|nr:hypothetical protein BpHYR1_034247 [Brachionus plicatilis]
MERMEKNLDCLPKILNCIASYQNPIFQKSTPEKVVPKNNFNEVMTDSSSESDEEKVKHVALPKDQDTQHRPYFKALLLKFINLEIPERSKNLGFDKIKIEYPNSIIKIKEIFEAECTLKKVKMYFHKLISFIKIIIPNNFRDPSLLKSHDLVLQIVFSSLISHWIVFWMIDNQKFHDTFQGFFVANSDIWLDKYWLIVNKDFNSIAWWRPRCFTREKNSFIKPNPAGKIAWVGRLRRGRYVFIRTAFKFKPIIIIKLKCIDSKTSKVIKI